METNAPLARDFTLQIFCEVKYDTHLYTYRAALTHTISKQQFTSFTSIEHL